MFCRQCGNEIGEGEAFCRKCGCKAEITDAPQKKTKKKNGFSPMIFGIAALAAAAVVTVNICRNFTDSITAEKNISSDAPLSADTKENASERSVSDDEADEDVPYVDMAEVESFLQKNSGEWKVKRSFDGSSWKTYELGKKMAIVAFNFLNDYEFDTGGYNKVVGYNSEYLVTYEKTWLGGHKEIDRKEINRKPIYEYVPVEHHEFHGTDLEYSCPYITITEDSVDMSGMGGPIFNKAIFRVENIDGTDYLINDYFGFAIMYDGDYIEYCEPDTYGHFQGYYAFDPYDSLVNATKIH